MDEMTAVLGVLGYVGLIFGLLAAVGDFLHENGWI